MGTRLSATVLMAILLAAAPLSAHGSRVAHYEVVFRPSYDQQGVLWIAIRQYDFGGEPYLLVLNPLSLETATVPATAMRQSAPLSLAALSETPFMRALERYTAPPYQMQNYGAVRATHPVGGVVLTVDMDPSKAGLDQLLFTRLAELGAERGHPIPVALAITGRWMARHGDELTWIQEQVTQHRLAITWINHSYRHPYQPGVPLERNFLLTAGIHFIDEVTQTEILLLEHDLVPSPFFRFPGLVASEKLVETLRTLSLIPVGSDAWLAKGQKPTDGSFILVHGNGNEPFGVTRFLRLIDERPGMVFVSLALALTER